MVNLILPPAATAEPHPRMIVPSAPMLPAIGLVQFINLRERRFPRIAMGSLLFF